MKRTVFNIDGGAGRVITAIPALKKYIKNNPDTDVRILVFGWEELFYGIPDLQDKVYSAEHRGAFDTHIKDADKFVKPEPYCLPSYYRQEKSLIEAFDEIINETDDHSDLEVPQLPVSKQEFVFASQTLAQARQANKPIVVIQPFGREAQKVGENDILDTGTRSFEIDFYMAVVKALSEKYTLVLMAEQHLFIPADNITVKLNANLRGWVGLIAQADYFIGCDSLGQHIARAVNKRGTVILGATFAKNTTYTDFHNVIEPVTDKMYSPIRITGIDCDIANRYNTHCMNFNQEQQQSIIQEIDADIQKTLGVSV